MSEPKTEIQQSEDLDQLAAGVFLAASFVLVTQLATQTALDPPLNTALFCFALSIPLLTLDVVDSKVKKRIKLNKWLRIARSIIALVVFNVGAWSAFIGIAAVFFHFSEPIGLLFTIVGISAYSLWGVERLLLGLYHSHLKRTSNLRGWQKSGQPQLRVESHPGQWERADWQTLLKELRESEFWPMDSDAVVGVIMKLQAERWNLRRWQESGQARDWVEAHQRHWDHDDWLSLLETLRQSTFWPIDPNAAGRLLEELKRS